MKVPFAPFLIGILLLSSPALAAQRQDFQALRAQAAIWLEGQIGEAHPDARARVTIGPIDARLHLAHCAGPRFFLATNARLWGRGSLGAVCADGTTEWTLYMTFDSRLSGPALVATRPLPARHPPRAGDVELREVEYLQSPDRYPRELPAGARVTRPLAAGQAIDIGMLALPNVIRSGNRVVVVARGDGFDVTQEGVAMNNAAAGERVRVKTASGRVIQGIAGADGRIEVRP